MDIQFLKTFLDIADSRNFTQSAERLGYAQRKFRSSKAHTDPHYSNGSVKK